MPEATALGIDLGTTLSVVAQVDRAGRPVVLPNAEGAPMTPSIVAFDGATAIVGEKAREALGHDPASVVQLVKRHMGSDWTFDFSGVSYRPEHVSAIILRKLHRDAELVTGPVAQAAVTVPAYFNDPMRSATRRSAELAGLDVVGLLSEPTAAALAFGYDQRPAGATGVVVDLGGGTFDVTVMDYDGHELAVRATGGDFYLGGANFDKVLLDYLVEQFRAEHGLDIHDPDALSLDECTQVSQDWLLRAEAAKHELSDRPHTTVPLHAAGLLLRVVVTREMFLQRSRPLLDEVSQKMLDVLAAAGVAPADVAFVLAVGGSTRIPAVRERITDLFRTAPDTSVPPDEAVALGAALFAAQRQLAQGTVLAMEDSARDYLEKLTITDVAAHTLGVTVLDAGGPGTGRQVVQPLLPRNTALPVEASRTLLTARPDERRIVVPVLEGEDPDPRLCRRIGEVVVDGLPPHRPAYQQVVVTMRLDKDGILHVSAVDTETGKAASTTIVHVNQQPDVAADSAVMSLAVE
jgi:molecular chaperone DnaK